MIIKKIMNYLFVRRNINIGKNTRVLTNIMNFGSEPYLVKIGSNCTITSGVKFITHDASVGIALRYSNKKRVQNGEKYELMGKILIGDNCMIGVNSIILPGVTIGSNSIIGAGSVVTKDVPEGSVVAGNPARLIMSIDEFISKNENKMKLIKIEKNREKRKLLVLKHLNINTDINEGN